jgi:DNA-binding YbaB/EbfC family protein
MDMKQMMAQAQKMQRVLEEKLKEFDQKVFEFDYKNGSIVVQMSGDSMIQKVTINKTLIDPEDAITLEEMIAEAINQATLSIKEDREAIQDSVTNK